MSSSAKQPNTYEFRLFDFVVNNPEMDESESSSDSEHSTFRDKRQFYVQMFGINEQGETCSICVENVKPFFYVKVDDEWTEGTKEAFLGNIKKNVGAFYENSIIGCKLVKRKKLYGFDKGREYKFVEITFENTLVMNKVKYLWYKKVKRRDMDTGKMIEKLVLNDVGYIFSGTPTKIYESNIPPLLRFFHINDISPSGWISFHNKHVYENKRGDKTTTCKYEFVIDKKNIVALNEKETLVPYKICSFDIEASSSHGDFPVPVKSYKKLATNILDYYYHYPDTKNLDVDEQTKILRRIVFTAFGHDNIDDIDTVFPKKKPSETSLKTRFDKWIKTSLQVAQKKSDSTMEIVEMFDNIRSQQNQVASGDGEMFDENAEFKGYPTKRTGQIKTKKGDTICDILCNPELERDAVMNIIDKTLVMNFPALKGDKVTFIGSTFLKHGEKDPYLNHCIVLDTCEPMEGVENSEIESYRTEKEVLLAWKELIQREDPDIIIGYNIFGFDYEFMLHRANETDCCEEFLKLSRNCDEVCGERSKKTGKYQIQESSIVIASGQHDLKFIKMNGRIQIDLYNYFRRDYNLSSYKLDSVSGHFIGDMVKDTQRESGITTIKSGNLTGLKNKSYICFEELGHSSELYADGKKFQVFNVDEKTGTFQIEEEVSFTKKGIRWCMAKDDVTPQDIFRLTNESATGRSTIAKYCIQDCNLVHYLMTKIDVLTGFIEMAKICSVPIDFIIMRGQGIKLLSFIAKKCRAKNTLLPVIEKKENDGGYEGAIVLDPKCNLYLDEPVACVDYSSLYPSSMISEGLSHDSKVWTKEYDLEGNLICETGEKTECGTKFLYDNLPDYKYVDVQYDTYKYVRKTPKSAATKVLDGKKICRFAQFPEGTKPIMPSILEELLAARKATRKKIKTTEDEFMKNVLDKRQLGYKITANSLYGQCGARTSSFYEKDVAASTTATGRKLLIYAKHIIEEVYGDRIVDTSLGKVHSHAEYIYGDTDSVFMSFKLTELDGTPITGRRALIMTIELAKEAGELATKFLKKPHDLEYEKTFLPFCLLSKKRYVGMLYEEDPDKCKCKSMGIVLKRRDNAPIVKDVYGGVIDILMKDKDIQKAIDFTKGCLDNIVKEKYPLDKLIISKSLRGYYKKPEQIAHKVLADRMGKRDPGNKPSVGDRIPFVYIHNKTKGALQGDKIEHPDFIRKHKVKPDYSFYITNQIMKPLQQVFALVLEKIPAFKGRLINFNSKVRMLKRSEENPEKRLKKETDIRNKEVKSIIFDEYLITSNNMKKGYVSITKFVKRKKAD